MVSAAEQIALWSDKLRDISAMGLHFSKNVHDENAFRAVQTTAMEMLALATGEPFAQIEPLRASIFARPTPLAVGDAAVIDGEGRILLIKRADNGKWATCRAGPSRWERLPRRGSSARHWRKRACIAARWRWSAYSIHACAARRAVINCTCLCSCVSRWIVLRSPSPLMLLK